MSELSKDPAIKLFGRTIPNHELQPNSTETELSSEPDKVLCKQTKDTEMISSNSEKPNISEGADPISSTSNNQNENVKEEESCENTNHTSKSTETDSQEVKSDPEKALKKPDKILPCPRCNSMDTKFCYYNNYNVNQPRHFCKNCQRYWTAGGTMRNVPVGAGRRKNKHPGSHNRHIMISSEALLHQQGIPLVGPTQLIGADTGLGTGTSTGTVMKFGTEVPLCESMTTVLNIEEERKSTDLATDEQPCASSSGVENRLHSCAVTGENNPANGFSNGGSLPPMPCYPGPAFMYPWGPAIPFPYMPAPFWGWHNGPGPWCMPWTAFPNGAALPSSPISNSCSSGDGSSTLGKHTREPALQSDEQLEKIEKKNLWAPKTLRIVNPDEAAKSSIWATLGIKPDDGSIFKPFGTKEKGKCPETDSGSVLCANPAALSRSRSFQEST